MLSMHEYLSYRCQLLYALFSSRSQFYVTVRRDFLSGSLHIDSLDTVQRLSAMLAQAELTGDITDHFSISSLTDVESCVPVGFRSAENVANARTCLESLRRHPEPLSRRSARSQFLREAAALPGYGAHSHEAYDEDLKKFLHVDIGPEGVTLRDQGRALVNW